MSYQIVFILGAGFVSFFLCRYLARRPHLLPDRPNARSSHQEVVSRGGGLCFAVPALALLLILFWDVKYPATQALCLGALLFAGLGAIDDSLNDRSGLSAQQRLLVSLLLVSFLCLWGLSDSMVLFGIHISGWGVRFLQILWVLTCINFFNFMDGMDGLAGLQAWWLSVLIAVAGGFDFNYLSNIRVDSSLTVWYEQTFWSYLGIASVLPGFLYWNWPRALVFMGDSGSYFLGFVLGFGALLAMQLGLDLRARDPLLMPEPHAFALDAGVILLAWMPFLLDAGLTLLERILSTGSQNIFKPHCGHLYQRLMQAKLRVPRILLFYLGLNLSLLIPIGCWLFARSLPLTLASALLLLSLHCLAFIGLKHRGGIRWIGGGGVRAHKF